MTWVYLGFAAFVALVVAVVVSTSNYLDRKDEWHRRRQPELCVSSCRYNAVRSANPREAFALCTEGCPK